MSYLTDPNELNPATVQWFRDNVLIGFTADRERWQSNNFTLETAAGVVPWFGVDYDPLGLGRGVPGTTGERYDGAFPGPIPIEEINKRLFHWTAEEAPLSMRVPCDVAAADGVGTDGIAYRNVVAGDYKAIYRSDQPDTVFNVTKSGYERHQYGEWLIKNVGSIVDASELPIESAGLLQQGGAAFVSISLPDIVAGNANFPLLCKLLAYTSHNGKFATNYQLTDESPVCSNSLDIAIAGAKEHGKRMKIKHTSNSQIRVSDVRNALGLLHQHSEEMTKFFDLLAAWEVSDKQFRGVLDAIDPVPAPNMDAGGKVTNQRSITTAETRRVEIATMYKRDARANQWDGTALGVLQAFNTWSQQVRGNLRGPRMERQMLDTMSGDVATFDSIVLNSLADVTGWCVLDTTDESAGRNATRSFDLVAVK